MTPLERTRLLEETWIAEVEPHATLSSTNDRAAELAKSAGTRLPLLVTAEVQTAGRGRGGNRWWTGNGSLAFSVLFDAASIEESSPAIPLVGLAAGLAVVEAVRPILGDHVQLQQVLLNLIMNGVEAMKGVTDRTRELTISSTLAEPRSVLVTVQDTGTGLDPAVAERMFQPFFTTKSDGLGMGLAICRSIVEAHGGRLSASPRAPHGADVRFTVPLWVDQ